MESNLERKCRKCGCTQNDCKQCIEKTGHPCTWVEEDLCSACVDQPEKNARVFVGIATNFFTQLRAAAKKDITLRIMEVNDRLTVGVFPGQKNKSLLPATYILSAEELDERFFTELLETSEGQMKPLPKAETSKDDAEEETEEDEKGQASVSPKILAKKKSAGKAKPEKKPKPKSKGIKKELAVKKDPPQLVSLFDSIE